MARALAVMSLLSLVLVSSGRAAVRIVPPFDPADLAGTAAIGLSVPGAGPTTTRASARNTLLTGKVTSSLNGGTPAGKALITLSSGAPPDTLVVLPPAERSANTRYPIAVEGGGANGVLTSDSTRIRGLVSLADVATGRVRWEADSNPAATLRTLENRIERNDSIRLPLSVLAGGIAYLVALFRPRLGPRAFLLALAGNLWLAGWWVVGLAALAAAVLPLGLACVGVLGAYLLTLGLDPEAVALSPFGPSQAGRFYGVSNLLETFLLVPALLGAAIFRRAGALVAALALVTIAGGRFGADGGGLIVLLVAFGLIALFRVRARITPGRALAVGAAAVALGALLVGLDALLGGSSHVTSAVGDGPWTLVTDIGHRLQASGRRTFTAVGPAFAVLASLAVAVWVATRRTRGPLTNAVLAALVVSLVVNDTPGDVMGVGAAALFTIWRWEQFEVRTASAAG